MKLQVAWSFKRARTELVVTPQRRELLDIPSAEWLRDTDCELLIPVDFDYALTRAKKVVLRYDILGLTTLRKRLRQPWDKDDYYRMLVGIEGAALACSTCAYPLERMLFDTDHIYLTERGEPRFIYLPLEGMIYDSTINTPLAALLDLSDLKRMKFLDADSRSIAAHLDQFIMTKDVFSLNKYRRFLDTEFPWRVQGGAGATGQSTGRTENEMVQEGSAIFLDDLFASFEQSSSGSAGNRS